jgi:hypothetical protein
MPRPKSSGRLPYAVANFRRVAHVVDPFIFGRQGEAEQQLIEAFEVLADARSVSLSYVVDRRNDRPCAVSRIPPEPDFL